MESASDLILRKGPFASVWIAGTSTDKLGKKMVLATDIADLVEQIKDNERINLVLRLSGMLLKGLVVVYSKKLQYMLTDCEDMITKIKLSFKTGQIDLVGKNARDETVTITTDISDLTVDPTCELSEWAKAVNQEDYFVVKHPPINFQSTESSQIVTDADSQPNSSLSSQSFDTPARLRLDNETLGSPMISAQTTPRRTYDEPQANWDEPDDIPPPPGFSDNEDDVRPVQQGGETSEGSELDAASEVEKEKRKRVIIDSKTQLGERRSQTRARRTITSEQAKQIAGNSQFDSLFADSRKAAESKIERNRTERTMDSDSDGFGGFEPGAPDSDEEVIEKDRTTAVVGNSDVADIPVSDDSDGVMIEPSDATPFKNPQMQTLESPFPQYKFVVEQTPRRTAEDSITGETIKTLNKFREVLKGEPPRESTTFTDTFSGCSRRQAASAFYQLLVLKSTGTVDVKQAKPFGQIEVIPGRQFWTA